MVHFDPSTWERREVYDFFSQHSNPYYMVTFRQDVTGLYNFKKANHISFYYAMIWACTKAINQVDAFHVALRNGELVYLPERKPNFIDLKPAAAHFHIVAMDMEEDICSFCRNTAVRSYEQKSFLEYYPDQQIFIYFTCMPWIDLTALSNERNMNTPDAMDDSIPRICWGKYKKRRRRKSYPWTFHRGESSVRRRYSYRSV